MSKTTIFLCCVFGLFVFISSCKEDEPIDIDCTTVTYSGTIQAIVANNCSNASCHGTNAPNGDYTSYDKIKEIATNGEMEKEVVVQKTMPQGRRLTDTEIAQVKCWLDDGAPNN